MTSAVDQVDSAAVFGALNHVGTIAAAMISRLPSMTDEEILVARDAAREIGKAAWHIECACDDEIVRRTEGRVGGRGRRDVEGTGAVATLRRIAAEKGVSLRTLYNNARIHRTFFSGLEETPATACAILEDKQFYTLALAAPDPRAALEIMAQKKGDNPFYSTRDAYEDVAGMRAGSAVPPAPAPDTLKGGVAAADSVVAVCPHCNAAFTVEVSR